MLSCMVFSEFHQYERIFEEHQDTERSTNAKAGHHFSLVSSYVKHHRKFGYICLKSKEITLRLWNKMQMPCDLKQKKEELLTTFQLTDKPVARRTVALLPTGSLPTPTP